MEKTKNQKPIIIAAVAFVVILVAGLLVWQFFGPKGVEGQKDFTLTVIDAAGAETVHTLSTEEEMLGAALQNEGLLEGDEGEYGLFITAVDGIEANEDNQEWWCLTKGGETVMTGVDMTPVEDGAAYELTLMVGW